jgi:hypothetical protein
MCRLSLFLEFQDRLKKKKVIIRLAIIIIIIISK